MMPTVDDAQMFASYQASAMAFPYRRASWTFGQSRPSEAAAMMNPAAYQRNFFPESVPAEPLSPVRERSQELPSAGAARPSLSHAGHAARPDGSSGSLLSHSGGASSSVGNGGGAKSNGYMGPPMALGLGAVGSVKARATQKKRKREEDEQARHVAEESKKSAALAAAVAASKKKTDDGPIRPPPHIVEAVRHRQLQRAAAREYMRTQPPQFPSAARDGFPSEDRGNWSPTGYNGSPAAWESYPGVSAVQPYSASRSAYAMPPAPIDPLARRYSWHASMAGLSGPGHHNPYSEAHHTHMFDANQYPRSSLTAEDAL